MKSFDYTIKDEIGIHARPAGLLVKCAAEFSSAVTISKGEKNVDAKKLFAVMGLGVKFGDTVTICANGEDETAALEALKVFFENNL